MKFNILWKKRISTPNNLRTTIWTTPVDSSIFSLSIDHKIFTRLVFVCDFLNFCFFVYLNFRLREYLNVRKSDNHGTGEESRDGGWGKPEGLNRRSDKPFQPPDYTAKEVPGPEGWGIPDQTLGTEALGWTRAVGLRHCDKHWVGRIAVSVEPQGTSWGHAHFDLSPHFEHKEIFWHHTWQKSNLPGGTYTR